MSGARFQKAVNSVFSHMGIDAQYQRPGRDTQTVRVILRQSDPMVTLNDRPLLVNHRQLDVRVSEIEEPRPEDLFSVNDKRYRVEDEPQLDQHRLIWRMTVLPVSDEQPQPVNVDQKTIPSGTTIPTQTTRLRM